MSETLDLASTIGTWIGAGVGIIALIGIVGPALIWYASTQDRQKTLNAVGRDSNDYLSPGYHLGPNIWLFQRVRAPMLKHAKSLGTLDTLPALDASKMKTIDTETSWILFGSLLEAYGIPFRRGDGLLIMEGRTLLPIHPSWILAIGLLGRYSNRRNQSGLLARKEVLTYRLHSHRGGIELPPPPTRQYVRPPFPARRYVSPWERPRDQSEDEVMDQDWEDIGTLYGTTGSFEFPTTPRRLDGSSPRIVRFTLHNIREAPVDLLGPKDLFLLSLGFLKTSKTRYIGLKPFDEMPEDWGDSSEGSSNDTERVIRRPPGISSAHQPRHIVTHANRYQSRRTDEAYNQESKIYRLLQIEPDQEILKIGGSFFGTGPIDMFMLMPLNSTHADPILFELSRSTKLPADSSWVRISKVDKSGYDRWDDFYIERISAQRLAFGLISLQWHPERYLLPSISQSGPGGRIFETAAQPLFKFVFRLSTGLGWLSLSQANKQKLSSALASVQARRDAGPGTRLYAAARELDAVLGELGSGGEQTFIDQIIAILTITNSEFRNLVYDSLRSLQETTNSLVQLEMPSATMKIPSAFGVMQHFYVDWQEMFPEDVRNHETIPVSYTVVVLAATRSLAKCQMLLSCPDSMPLISTVMGLGDVVHMN